jgi:uncharacterized protein (TIGR02145 family)
MKTFTILFDRLTGNVYLPIFLIAFFFFSGGELFAQVSTDCPNSDFSDGNFTGWTGCYGKFSTPCTNQGFLTGGQHPLHKIIHAPGWYDYNTCNGLLTVYPGNSYVARLGDTMYTSPEFTWNKEAELNYPVTVTLSSYLFIYRYAPVLQTGGHPVNWQPDFRVEVTDSSGALLDSCGYFYFPAPNSGAPPAGWNRCTNNSNGNVYWKDWTTVGMDLTPYFGQTVYINFRARGCYYDTHFGYAYVTAFCGYLVVHTSLCEGDSSATLTAPPGFTYLWNTGDTTESIVVPHPTTGSSYSCTLTALNGCQVTITDTLTYTVIHADFTHGIGCATLPTQFDDSSYVNQNTVTGWNWNFGDGSSPVTGNPNPTHIFATSGDFNVTLISFSTEGCSDTITKTVHVDSLPVITNTDLRQRICNNVATNITLNSTVSNTLYTWTTTVSSPNISGYSNNPTTPSTFTNQTLTNSGNNLDSVIYHFTPHSSLCTGTVTNFVVVVCPVPLLSTTPLVETICDSINTNIALTSNVDSTRFTWTCTANPGNHLSGYSNYTTLPGILNINQVIYNSGYNIDTVHYHITGNAYGCSGPIYDYRVIVNPFPDLSTVPLSKSLCSQDYTNVNLTSHVLGTQFTWTCTPSGPGITGWSNNTIPSTFLNQQLFNSTTAAGTVTYYITPHANNCNGHVYQYTVTVKPIPAVTNTVNPALCSGSTTNIILQSNIPGSTYAWTATGSSPNVSGYSNSSGPVISQILTNTGFNTETVIYSVVATNNGCSGTSSNITVTVYPVADVNFTPVSNTLCSAQTTNFSLSSHVAGSTFTWTASGSSGNVSGYSPGSGNSIAQTLNNSGTSIETVDYIAQPTANGCSGIPGEAIATVDPVPVVTYTLCHDNITTLAAQPIKLAGGIPLGGNYSGSGVNVNIFYPAIAGIGNHTITYTYINYLGCIRNASQVITVVNVPAFFCGNNLTDIRDNTQYPTVKLGTRCWMAANLNFGISIVSSNMQRNNCINEKYCYNDNTVNCTNYGGLYQWDEMMRYDNTPAAQGFCPPGWHVPTENEWNALFLIYVSNGFAGSPLKYTGYSGFNAFLSGVRFNNVSWDFFNFAIMFWSSTQEAPLKAWAHGMNTFNPSVSYYPSSKTHAFAVRCIQD